MFLRSHPYNYRIIGDNMQLSLIQQLKKCRKWHKLTQQDLADKVDSSQQTIFRLEAGENVGYHLLLKIADVLGYDIALINTPTELL